MVWVINCVHSGCRFRLVGWQLVLIEDDDDDDDDVDYDDGD